MMPKDPHMLASYINTRLRDFYPSLDALCDDMGADKEEILERLAAASYHYDPDQNRLGNTFPE